MKYLLLLLLLPAIGRAQVKLQVKNPTPLEIRVSVPRLHMSVLLKPYHLSPAWLIDTLRPQEQVQVQWLGHVYVQRYNMHVDPITRGEWILYAYPDHTDSTKWIV